MAKTIQIEWSDVKGRFIDSVRHGKSWGQAQQGALSRLHSAPYAVNDWEGGSGAQTLEWLDNGFYAPELQAGADLIPVAETPTPMWGEEPGGDVDTGRLYGGYDDFYFDVAPSEAQPGLKLTADVFFAASVKPHVIKAYGAWLVGLVGALEGAGYDLEVSACTPVRNLYDGATGRQNVEIRVKRAGELSDFTEWSALFSPTGVRHLVFTAFGVASERLGKTQTAHMSTSLSPTEARWAVTYDREANHLHVSANQRSSGAFPAEHMAAQLKDSGLI